MKLSQKDLKNSLGISNSARRRSTKLNVSQQQMKSIDAQKNEFIEQYGVQFDLPSTYISDTFFYHQNSNYLIKVCTQVFKTHQSFYNFENITANVESQLGNTDNKQFLETHGSQLNNFILKVYSKKQGQFKECNIRIFDESYYKYVCFSQDHTRMAVIRETTQETKEKSFQSKETVVDVYDCSDINFFLKQKQNITTQDERYLLSINLDSTISTTKDKILEEVQLSFSNGNKYLQVLYMHKTLHTFLIDTKNAKHFAVQQTPLDHIPQQYEKILKVSINEQDIQKSLIAILRSDFKNIDILSLGNLLEMSGHNEQDDGPLKKSFIKSIQDKKINVEKLGSIKVESLDINSACYCFSRNQKKFLFCNENQKILLDLHDREGLKPSHQRDLSYLIEKPCREIFQQGEDDFLIVSADSQDQKVTIIQAQNPTNKVKFDHKYSKNQSKIRNVVIDKDHISKILISKGDEEIQILEFNQQQERTFWQQISSISNYVLEWPYLCYIFNETTVIIQNVSDPSKIYYIEASQICKDSIISHIFVTYSHSLFVVLSTDTEYLIYERNLSICHNHIFQQQQSEDMIQLHYYNAKNIIGKIEKKEIHHQNIYQFYIKGSSHRDLQKANDIMIFFVCDYKLYHVSLHDGRLTIVDHAIQLKEIKPNLLAYLTCAQQDKKEKQIKFLRLCYSDFHQSTVYEDVDSNLIEFHVQEEQLLLLQKNHISDKHQLKIFDICEGNILKLKTSIDILDENLIGTFKTVKGIVNNIIPSGNNLYYIVFLGEVANIHYYHEVIPTIDINEEQSLALLTQVNPTYRKMLYFIKNTKHISTKKAIILPYMNDNFVQICNKDNIDQFYNFFQNSSQQSTDILNLSPNTQEIHQYCTNGQVIDIKKLDEEYKQYGENNLAISPNGQNFLQLKDSDQDTNSVSILKMIIESQQYLNTNQDTLDPTPRCDDNIKPINTIQDNKESEIVVSLQETINFGDYQVNDTCYEELNWNNLQKIIKNYKQQKCQILYKMNNNLDIMIGFLHTQREYHKDKSGNGPVKQLKDLLLLKKIIKNADNKSIRKLYKIRLPQPQSKQNDTKKTQYQELDANKNGNLKDATTSLLQEQNEYSLNKSQEKFLRIDNLGSCFDFQFTDDMIMLWSNEKIYYYDMNQFDFTANKDFIQLDKAAFEIDSNLDETIISNISAVGYTYKFNDNKLVNYNNDRKFYIYIKLIVENHYATFIKYNINTMKEYQSIDCSKDAQIFFDYNNQGYILDSDYIIDFKQAVPLYYYKTGIKDVNLQNVMDGAFDKGSRFCSRNYHFIVNNRLYLPNSYFSYIYLQNTEYQIIDQNNYNPDTIFSIYGMTNLHHISQDYKSLSFILNIYEKTDPQLLNMILIKDCNNNTVLDLVLKSKNSKCVNLVLEKLSQLTYNNIHSVKHNFSDLLEYSGFDSYLTLCFEMTQQMQSKTFFQRKNDTYLQNALIEAHNVSFFDKEFYAKFQDPDSQPKSVDIKCVDAGWLIKHESGKGIDFLSKLSESNDMKYFENETIKTIVNYQWKIIKPKIIYFLFIPFLLNLVLFDVYCLHLWESGLDKSSESFFIWENVVQSLIMLFSVHTFYVEFFQIMYHRKEYLKSFWNLLDFTSIVLVPAIMIMNIIEVPPKYMRPTMACGNLLLHLRLFYFLRIFDATAHMIRTIIEITIDIRHFISVLLLALLACGGSFFLLSNNNTTDEQFITSYPYAFAYSYRLTLGDFDTDDFSGSTNNFMVWTLFVVSTMFSTIILLNMLVAIMGESFNRVTEQAQSQTVREHLQLIMENDFLLNRKKYFGNVKYLIEIRDDQVEGMNDQVEDKIEIIDQKNEMRFNDQNDELTLLKEMIKEQSIQIAQMKNDMNHLKDIKQDFASMKELKHDLTQLIHQLKK